MCSKCKKLTSRKGYCLECARAYSKKYYEAHKEKQKKYSREYHNAHQDECRERSKQYYRDNKDQALVANRRWKLANPEAYADIQARDYPKKLIRNLIRYRTLQGLDYDWGYPEWEQLKKQYKNKCLCCGRSEPDIALTVDHIQPVVTGGSNLLDNIQPLCKPCNSRKFTKIIDYRLTYA